MKLNCLIVDDEPLALDLLENYVNKTPFLNLAGRCENAFQAMERVRQNDIDLLFLDIQMPDLNGIEFSKTLGERPKVIFTTAFDQYAVEGFRVDALDYLLKPISYSEFLQAANKAMRWFELSNKAVASSETANTIFVKSDYKLVQIDLIKVLYIEGVKDYVRIFLEDDAHPIMSLMSMKLMEERLPADRFMRVHRSFIVQLDKIKTIERNRIVFGKEYIPISDSYKEKFMEFLNKRFFS